MVKAKKMMGESSTGRTDYRPSKFDTSSSEEVAIKKKSIPKKTNMRATLETLRKMVQDQNASKTAVPPASIPLSSTIVITPPKASSIAPCFDSESLDVEQATNFNG